MLGIIRRCYQRVNRIVSRLAYRLDRRIFPAMTERDIRKLSALYKEVQHVELHYRRWLFTHECPNIQGDLAERVCLEQLSLHQERIRELEKEINEIVPDDWLAEQMMGE